MIRRGSSKIGTTKMISYVGSCASRRSTSPIVTKVCSVRMRKSASMVAYMVLVLFQEPLGVSPNRWVAQAVSPAYCSPKRSIRSLESREARITKITGTTVFSLSDSEGDRPTIRVVIDKTYDNPPFRKEVIDREGAMISFFSGREDWMPLFRSVAGNDLPKDTSVLLDSIVAPSERNVSPNIDISETSYPWKLFNAIPVDEEHRTILARFLDSMQESLLAIPVVEQSNYASVVGDDSSNDFHEDENDVQFIEEGRRLLAINRFHVLPDAPGFNGDSSTLESMDALFTHCWSEICVLSQAGTVHSGSLILLSNQYELVNVRRFLEMNVIQPLLWLGIHNDFEVCSFQRDSPAIRLIFKLNDLPATASYTEEDGFAASS
jgi:hypothetical protein